MLLAVHLSSYGCTWEIFRLLKKLELSLHLDNLLRLRVLCIPCPQISSLNLDYQSIYLSLAKRGK